MSKNQKVNKKSVNETSNLQWTEQELARLPLICLKILFVFVKKDKKVLYTDQIQKALNIKGIEGKKLGSYLANFGRYSKEPLLYQFGKGRWLVSEKYWEKLKSWLSNAPLED